MKNPVALSSQYISQFGFTALFDLHLKNITVNVADLTILKIGGAGHVSSIKFDITDPIGFSYDQQSVDVLTLASLVIPMADLSFGPYSIKATITDSDGVSSSIVLLKNISEPANWNKTSIKGLFDVTADCRIPLVKISDRTDYAYLGALPVSQTKEGKLFYPDNIINELPFTYTPFTVGGDEGIYTGLYRIKNLTLSTYDLGDNITLILPAESREECKVDCDSGFKDVLTCVSDLYQKYIINKGTAKGIQAKDLLDSIYLDLIMAILKGQSGLDNSEEIAKIKLILNCKSGCGSTVFLEPGLTESGSSFSISGAGGTEVTREILGSSTRFRVVSKNIDIQPAPGDTSFKITKSVTDDLVLFEVEIDYNNLIEEINLDGLLSDIRTSIQVIQGQISLKVSQADFNSLGQRVALAETSIIQTAQNIALKASQTSVDALTGRLTSAEASLVINAAAITGKVSQSTFDALNNRVGLAEASLVINANAIITKVSQTTFDALNNRVGLAEASIVVNATAITSKVSQSTFDALNNRVGLAEASIVVNATAITSKVSQSTFDALNNRVGLAEASIVVNATAITSKVSVTTFNSLGDRVGSAETRITQTESAISSMATSSTIDALTGRVTTAEGKIDLNTNAILLKVSQSTFDALNNRVGLAEASIVVNTNAITSKVSSTDFNGNTIVSMINQSPDTIKIQAKNIMLDGLTTARSVESSLGFPKVTMNKDNDNAFKAWYNNGQVGIVVVAGEDGEPVLKGFDRYGNEKWNLGAGSSQIVFITSIPATWTEQKLKKMVIPLQQADYHNQSTSSLVNALTSSNSQICYISDHVPIQDEVKNTAIVPGLTAYYYNAGSNPDSAANAQYEGYKTANYANDPSYNIADGWYIIAGIPLMTDYNFDPPQYALNFFYVQGGKVVDSRYTTAALDAGFACNFN